MDLKSAVLDKVVSAGSAAVSLFTGLLAGAMILYSGYVLYDNAYMQTQAVPTEEIRQYRPEVIDDDSVPLTGSTLAAVNSDYRAWLTLDNTIVDYPVMQAENDVYYASRDIYGESSLTGSIYLSAGNSGDLSDTYNIIYGHHMDANIMFGALDQYLTRSYFDSHRTGVLVASSGLYDLRVFAVLRTDAYDETVYAPGNNVAAIISYLRNPGAGAQTLILDDAAAAGAQRVVALSTCENLETDGRIVVFATMTKRNLLRLDLTGYSGVYDGRPHSPQARPSVPENTTVEYSTDGGRTWSARRPSITDVGEIRLMVRATNPVYGTVTGETTLRVTPKAVTVRANNSTKAYGQPDPAFSASVTGLIGGDTIRYTVSRRGSDEAAGTYRGVIVPSGEARQGNYQITYVPADFEITDAGTMTLTAAGYTGVYDGQPHFPSAAVSIPAGTTIEYSTDGGATWTTTPPSITNVGTLTVLVRAVNPNYETVTSTVTLTVTPATVTVRVNPSSKTAGSDDPAFTAEVEGLVDGTTIVYTVGRTGDDEEVGIYDDVLVATGDASQGNYNVVFVPADFEIMAAPVTPEEAGEEPEEGEPEEYEEIEEETVPRTDPTDVFRPTGGSFGDRAWALINLICLIITVYLFLPLLHLKAKYRRAKLMKAVNEDTEMNGAAGAGTPDEEDPYYEVKKFVRRFRIGAVLELVISIAAIVAFILTEDMRLPMILIDKWTPLMILFLLLCWVVDVRLARYRGKINDGEEASKQA